MADPKELSSSKIAFYRGCPQACLFRYVGIDGKRIKAPISPAAAFGVETHYMSDQLYKKKQKGEIIKGVPKWESVEKCLGTWKYRWLTVMKEEKCRGDSVRFNSEFEKWSYYWTGIHILKGFYNKMINLPWPVETEKSYRGKIAGEKIMARIDRLDIREEENEEKHIITDYKTDRRSPKKEKKDEKKESPETLEGDTFLLHRLPQFTLQSYLYEKNTGIRPHIYYLHLRSGQAFKTRRNEGDYEYLEGLVKDVADDIRNDRFRPFYGFHCNMCDYKDYPCREYAMGVDGKLKALEIAKQTSPEIADWISFEVEKPKVDLFEKILSKIPKSLAWVGSTLEKIFADYMMMKDTIEEIGLNSLEFISAMQEPDDEEPLSDEEELLRK